MNGFAHYYFGTIVRPARAFEALVADSKGLRYGTYALLLNAFWYTLVYVFLTMGGGAPSTFTPWLAIPLDQYYYYDRFMLAPSMFIAWILAAGLAQFASTWCGGRGRFEDMLATLGFAINIATLPSLLHDLPDTFLGAIGVLDLRDYEVLLNEPTIWRAILWTLYGASAVCFVVLFPKAVSAAQKLPLSRAIPIGLLAFAGYQGLFLVFNR